MEITKKITDSCGEKPETTELVDVGNDPNFVFENDPLFERVILYDPEANIIHVNSWLECAHYVNGGWVNDLNLFINEERIFFLTILVISTFSFFFNKFLSKRNPR